MTWWIGVQAAIAASAAAIIVAIIYNYVWCTEEKDPKTRIEILWWSTLPWVPYIFSVFVAADLPCEGNRISGIALLRTFGSAGSISAVNALTMFALVEALVICRRRWKMKSQWGAFAVAFTGVILFWTWHLFVLVWVEDYLLPSYLGLYIALHATTLVLALGLGFAAGYKSTIVSFPKHAVGSGEKNKWCKSPEFWWSIVLTAGVVAGVIFLGSSTESVLVSIIGELPVISTITTAWVYKNNPEALDDIRCWVHSIQLFYKSCPFFLLLSCAYSCMRCRHVGIGGRNFGSPYSPKL